MASSGPFKFCTSCRGKIPFSDGHYLCLFSLGKAHQPDSCIHCKKLIRPALCLRIQRLRSFLWEKYLSTTMDASTAPPASAGPTPTPPMSGTTKSKSKSKPAKSKSSHKAEKIKKKLSALALMLKDKTPLSGRSAPSPTVTKANDQTPVVLDSASADEDLPPIPALSPQSCRSLDWPNTSAEVVPAPQPNITPGLGCC